MIYFRKSQSKQGWLGRLQRRGAAVLETALCLPILLSLGFGTIEFGHYYYVKHTLQGAARAGARLAIIPGSTSVEVQAAVTTNMTAAGFSSGEYTVTLNPTNLSSAEEGDSITVTVAANWGTVGVQPLGIIGSEKSVTGVCVMMREGQ